MTAWDEREIWILIMGIILGLIVGFIIASVNQEEISIITVYKNRSLCDYYDTIQPTINMSEILCDEGEHLEPYTLPSDCRETDIGYVCNAVLRLRCVKNV